MTTSSVNPMIAGPVMPTWYAHPSSAMQTVIPPAVLIQSARRPTWPTSQIESTVNPTFTHDTSSTTASASPTTGNPPC